MGFNEDGCAKGVHRGPPLAPPTLRYHEDVDADDATGRCKKRRPLAEGMLFPFQILFLSVFRRTSCSLQSTANPPSMVDLNMV